MNRNLLRTALLVTMAASLSACSMFVAPAPNRLNLGLTPNNELGYEVDENGVITITNRNMILSTRAGAPVTTVTGYHIDYIDHLGNVIAATADDPRSLNITVPAGFVCDEPDPVVGCTMLSAGARPGPAPR